ncbi:MAG: cytochrome c [Ignavibacteriales bacterium]|nr:cytochrome c [Ignavibacteriales bacterium]MBK8947271.1 cytochrome c [Ignavibacteriota bacterium]
MKILKILALIIGLIVSLVIIAIVYFNASFPPHYENKAPNITVELNSERIAEGKKIVSMTCALCHKSEDGKLSGKILDKDSPVGTHYAPNITKDFKNGIGRYTDGELIYLLRTGITKEGKLTPPWMSRFPNLSDEDIFSIVAFLKSDDSLVDAVKSTPGESEPTLLFKILMNVAFKPIPYPKEKIIAPSIDNIIAYGKYLATAKYECFGCHSKDFSTVNILEPEKSEGYFGGGNQFINPEDGTISYSKNLTMDESGLGNWNLELFTKVLKSGNNLNGSKFKYPMSAYNLLTDSEINAIWSYLNSIPKIK